MALGPGDLVLCAGTLPGCSFRERVRAALAGGFRGISLFGADVRRARAEGLDDADMRGLLADAGLEVAEIDPLLSWLPGALPVDGGFATSERECYEIASRIGGRGINAVAFPSEPVALESIVESFAGLCERASDEGLLVHLEFLPWTQVATASDALRIAELAGCENGGVTLDAWHHFRGPLSNDDLRALPVDRILAVQLCDAPEEAEADLAQETLHRRRVPGEGDVDLPELLRVLRDGGSPAPLGVEVFSDALSRLPPDEVAVRCANGVRRALARR